MTTQAAPPIDPLSPSVGGRYEDALVVVEARGHHGRPQAVAELGQRLVRTPHFEVFSGDGRLHVAHRLAPAEVDDDLAGLLSEELFVQGWVRGSELFERIFTGVVLSTDPDPEVAWEAFYRNSIRRIEDELDAPSHATDGGHGSIAEYAPVYRQAAGLIVGGSVLELGSCFGFFSLLLAQWGEANVMASDISRGTVDLMGRMAGRLGVPLRTMVADATAVPLADRCADTVVCLHLLEHLDAEQGDQLIAEALRLAGRRVVVAVPLEEEPDEAFGHLRALTLDDLRVLGAGTGWPWHVFDDHGGWLVLDRAASDVLR